MAKRKTVLRIEGLSSPEAPELAIAAPEGPQVAAVEEPQEQKPAEVPQEAPAAAEEPKATPAPKPKAAPAPKPKPASKPHVGVSVAAPTEDPVEPARETTVPRAKAKPADRAAEVAPTSRGTLPKPLAWVERIAPGHVNAVLGGLAGLIVALLVFVVGFWKTLFVCALVVVGVAVGQCLDGDPKIVNKLRQLLADERGDEQG